jgi:hypothetical protein
VKSNNVVDLVRALGANPTEDQVEAMALLAFTRKPACLDKSLVEFRVEAYRTVFRDRQTTEETQ